MTKSDLKLKKVLRKKQNSNVYLNRRLRRKNGFRQEINDISDNK